MNGMGCTGEPGQTSKAGQFLRLHHSTWKRLSIKLFWKPMQLRQE